MGRRDCHAGGAAQLLTKSLVITKENHLVFLDRAADGPTKLIVETAGDELAGDWVARCLLIRITREGCIALAVVERTAMETVRSRLCLRRHDRGNCFAEFGVEVLCCNLCFRPGIERRVA